MLSVMAPMGMPPPSSPVLTRTTPPGTTGMMASATELAPAPRAPPPRSPLHAQLLRQHSAPAALAPMLAVDAAPCADEWYSCTITRDANGTFGVTLVDHAHGELKVAEIPGENARSAGVRLGSVVHSIAGKELGHAGPDRIREILADPSVSHKHTVVFVFRHPASEASEPVVSTPLPTAPAATGTAVSPVQAAPTKRRRTTKSTTVTKRWDGKTESWGAREIIAFFDSLEAHGRNFQQVADSLSAQGIQRTERQTRNYYNRLTRRLREWYTKNGRTEVIVEEPAEPNTMNQAKKDKQMRQLLCFWEMMKESPEQLTVDNTLFPPYAVPEMKKHLESMGSGTPSMSIAEGRPLHPQAPPLSQVQPAAQSQLPCPERLVVLLTPVDDSTRDAVITKLRRDIVCLRLSEVRAKKPIASIIRHCMKKWPLEREFGVESLSLFPRQAMQGARNNLHWSLTSADLVKDVARAAGDMLTATLELTYGWHAPLPTVPPPAPSTDESKSGAASDSHSISSSPPVTEPAMPRRDSQQHYVEGVEVSGLGGVHLGAAFDAAANGKKIPANAVAAPAPCPSTVAAPLSPATRGVDAVAVAVEPVAALSAGDVSPATAAQGDEPVAAEAGMLSGTESPAQRRPARFAGSEQAVLEMEAAAQRVSLSQQTQHNALGTASAVPASSSASAGVFDVNRWAANATAATYASSPSASEEQYADLSTTSQCVSAAQPHQVAATSDAAAAASNIFGKEDSLPVQRLDIDEGLDGTGTSSCQELDPDDLDEFTYVDFQFDTLSPSGGTEPSAEATKGGIAAVHSLLPDLEARAAQMDADLEGELAW